MSDTEERGGPPAAEVRAAGVVVYRRAPAARPGVEVLLLRCARLGHWTPPKGRLDPGEGDLEGALRETEEEAGIGRSDLSLDEGFRHVVRYQVRRPTGPVPKRVVYYLGEVPRDLPIRLSEEHDDLAWLSFDQARERVRYANLREALDAAEVRIAARTGRS